MALKHLEQDPFAEGDFYSGDLLKNVASVEETFWTSHPDLRTPIIRALERALDRINEMDGPEEFSTELSSYLARHRTAAEGAA
jgi:contact-dependent growth inhibition (CDI) system CdiI-like immunity protein